MDGLQLLRPDCQTVGFVSSLLSPQTTFQTAQLWWYSILCFLFVERRGEQGQDLDKINLLVCMYVITVLMQ